jgi:RNA-directed DNA polymerase
MHAAKFFAISTTKELAAYLKVSPGEINHVVSRLDREYRARSRRKPDGTKRILFVPSERLKLLQRKIYDHILVKIPLLPCAKGGVPGNSPIENAAIHTNKAVVFKMDIAQCYPSIKPVRVLAIFQALGFGYEAAGLLTRLTTFKNELPQGVPTSNALTNLALARVDWRITSVAEQFGFDYSRWVDDITLSGRSRLLKFQSMFKRIVESEGFQVKAEKTKTELANERQTVTNFVVNTKVNLSKEKRSAIKKAVKEAHGQGSDLSPSIAGKMFWLRTVNPAVGGRLVRAVLNNN